MSGSSPLHVVTLGEETIIQNDSPNKSEPTTRPRTATASEKSPPKDALPRPTSAAINRYKANQSARDKRRSSLESPSSARAPITLEIKNNLNALKDVSDSVSFSSPIKKDFQYLPDTFVNTISKTTAVPAHSGPPVGAHTSGFYSKLRMENNRPSARASITLTSMLSEITSVSKIPKPETMIEEKEPSPNGNRVSFFEESKNNAGTVTIIDTYIAEPDLSLIEDCLAQLTDVDAHTIRILDSLNDLLDATDTDTGNHCSCSSPYGSCTL
jgi:hypothetical protein